MDNWKRRIPVLCMIAGIALLGIQVYLKSPLGSDFSAYYIAGLRLQAHQGLYEQNSPDNLYVYPPIFALLLYPLSFFPLGLAAALWFLVNLVCLGLTLRLLQRDLFAEPSREALFIPACVLALIFCARFLINHLLRGQVNLVLLALIATATHLALRDRPIGSAVAIALAGSIKPFALIAALPLCRRGGLSWLTWCFLSLVLLNVMPGLFYGFSANLHLLLAWSQRYAFPSLGAVLPLSHEPLDFMNQSLMASCYRLLTPVQATTVGAVNFINLPRSQAALVAMAVSSLFAVIGIARMQRVNVHTEEGLLRTQAQALALASLLPPLSWKANFVLLLYPAVLLFRNLLVDLGKGDSPIRLGFLPGAAFLSGSLLLYLPNGAGELVQAYGAVTLCGLLVWWGVTKFRS